MNFDQPLLFIIFLISLAILCGITGCLVLWKRMGFLGDTLAHTSLLGIAFSILLGIDITYGILTISISLSYLVFLSRKSKHIQLDSLLSILSYSCLALSSLILFFVRKKIDLNSYLFGDILLASTTDLYCIIFLGIFIILALSFYKKIILFSLLDEELAQTSHINAAFVQFFILTFLSLVISFVIKISGVFLTPGLIIIPASIGRLISHTPQQMLFNSVLICIVGLFLAFTVSHYVDVPLSPITIMILISFFIPTYLFKRITNLAH